MEIEKAAPILKVLGDKTRLTILKLIEHQTCCVCEFVEIFQMSQPSISQHLRKLKDVHLIQEERRGQWIFYSLNQESEWIDLVRAILAQLPDQQEKLTELEKSGARITCC
ncbi:metalloregulator ArsR/SmtB family transcription factor [Gracilibacillus sp. S3-1-1]|uniref:Metalloregulator ArsR/SmtB family transcription factor n=1 Tax=Gracilibacillus pellucidus TaxID=3095368 RepID=A0ACC6M4W7_9BACI|nr:metalloregulator ArsR/SmtB family transcription factor [Gracilibacillus sp. S3-1-1]MDX8045872.1 metalloregulator ArsR/SmtB family transcription factor [Gracilibacillus sp. S3-1-1]